MANILLKQIVADVAWSGATGFYGLSGNYFQHSSNKDIHFPSSNLTDWLDTVYESIGASGAAWSGASGYIGHSGNASVHVSVTEEANWNQAYDWVNGSSQRYEEILASGNEYSSAYASSQSLKIHSFHAIISGQYIKDYIASSTAIEQFYPSSLGKALSDFSSNAINLYYGSGIGAGTSGTVSTLVSFSSNSRNLYYPSSLGQILSSQVWDVYTSTNEPTGFLNRTDSTLYWSDVDRQFAISAASATFDYYLRGTKYTIASANIQISDTTGLHYLYLSSNRDFIDSVSPDLIEEADIFRNKPLVSIIYWNKSSQTAPYVGEERHGIQMDGDTHQYLHYVEGTRWLDGLALNTISSNGDGDEDSHAQFGVDVGTVIDEDISIDNSSVDSTIGLPIYYRSGTSGIWFKTTNAGFSVLTIGTGRLAWNQNDSGNWSLQEVDNLDFVLAHVFGTTKKEDSVISIIGQTEYDGTADAREGATTEVNSLLLGDLPGPEMRPIATVIFQTANGYGNAVKGRIRTTDEDDDYVDWRTTAFGRGTAASDHGSLGGGGGARDTYVIPGSKSPWTHKQRDTILEDTKETRGLLKEVSENIDKYHDEEIESISKSSNEIKLRINEILESIVNIKKDMTNKKDSGDIIKKLNDTTKILIKYKDDLKPEIGMNDIDELKLRLDEIDTMITKILVSNMRDEDVDNLMENIKDKNNE